MYSRPGEIETFARKAAIAVAFGIALVLLWVVRDILVLIFIAACLAAGIAPAVHWVRIRGRFWLRRDIPRGAAVVLVYFPFLFLVTMLAVYLVPRLIAETSQLSAELPTLIETNILTPLEHYIPMGAAREYLKGGVGVPNGSVFGYVRSFATVLASIVAVAFMIAYMLIDAHRLRNVILLFYPPEVRADRRRMLNRIASRMSSWLSGQLFLSGLMGIATFVCLLLLRIPFALPLAILA
ncbi:MAG TPA: AI-2E family transporter, partial [Thermoanaerobaculia bacterium]|nr:AI-2E family transporter [Thermoanaerobaculia bacterium]